MSDKEQNERPDWPVVVFLVVALPLSSIWGGFWIGLGVFIVGIVVLGWSKRHSGPFPTNKLDDD